MTHTGNVLRIEAEERGEAKDTSKYNSDCRSATCRHHEKDIEALTELPERTRRAIVNAAGLSVRVSRLAAAEGSEGIYR